MNELERKLLLTLVFIVATLIPSYRLGRERRLYFEDWPSYTNRPEAKYTLPRFIRKRYRLKNERLDIVIYLLYIVDFFGRIHIALMIIPLWLFDFMTFGMIYLATVFPIFVLTVIQSVNMLRTIIKDNKFRREQRKNDKQKKKKDLKSRIQKLKEQRETTGEIYEWRVAKAPFIEEIEREEKKVRGVPYLPKKNLGYVTDVICPKYEEYFEYEITKDGRLFSATSKRSGEKFYEVKIK